MVLSMARLSSGSIHDGTVTFKEKGALSGLVVA